jgi:hypothetical protein
MERLERLELMEPGNARSNRSNGAISSMERRRFAAQEER